MATSAADRSNAAATAGIEGAWMGALKLPNGQLRIVFHISRGPDSSLIATMDSPDQGATGVAVDEVTWTTGHLHLGLKAIQGAFEGNLRPQADSIDGSWTQGGASFPLVLGRTESAPQILRPQEPKPPLPYDAEEVSYQNPRAAITLAGTLTLPRGGGKFPAVLLITGSGPQDRDEQVFGHRPFLVLADYLTRRGIAVLRADDRGVGKSTGDFRSGTSEDFAGDVLAGVDYLKSRKEIDPSQIGLIGHSEGGIIAPMVAARSKDIAFIVMMAGTGVTGEQVLYMQDSLISKAGGASDSAIHVSRALEEQIFTVIKQNASADSTEPALRKLVSEALANEPDMRKLDSNAINKAVEMQVRQLLSPWLRYFLTYDPAPTLKKVSCPVLAINGEKDFQVPPAQNLPAIEAALKEGGNKNYTVKELPGLNHLFQTASTGSPDEYVKIEETMAPMALSTIGDWILKQAGRSGK
jgi:hypothetical protein